MPRGAQVDPAIDDCGRGEDSLAKPCPADDPPGRLDARDRDVPRLAGEVYLPVGTDRRAVVVTRSVQPPLLLEFAGACVEDGEEPAVACQVDPVAIVQGRGDDRQVLLL
jgi:hypothetical protein